MNKRWFLMFADTHFPVLLVLLVLLVAVAGPLLAELPVRVTLLLFAAFFVLSVTSLSLVVVITEIGVRAKTMSPQMASVLVGAAVLSLLLFPTIAGQLLHQRQSRSE